MDGYMKGLEGARINMVGIIESVNGKIGSFSECIYNLQNRICGYCTQFNVMPIQHNIDDSLC